MTDTERHMEAALGYLQLGLYDDANDEIECMPPRERVSPVALVLRAHIYMELKSWGLLREVAVVLVDTIPEDSDHWTWLAYATRRTTDVPSAEEIVLRALEIHPEDAMIHYNLACYAAQLGRLEEAGARLKKAVHLNPEIRLMALDDPDLEPIW